jgi:hypothetical protein
MNKFNIVLVCLTSIALLYSCSGKPSEKDISKKILMEYGCAEIAKVNNLKILKTKETESTGGPHVFNYTVSGEVEWPEGCKEMGTNTTAGTKEKFERQVVLTKAEDSNWQ